MIKFFLFLGELMDPCWFICKVVSNDKPDYNRDMISPTRNNKGEFDYICPAEIVKLLHWHFQTGET